MASIYGSMGSALYSTLAAGTALTSLLGGTAIWNGLVPQGTATPYVVFTFSGQDDNTSPRRARTIVATVKAVDDDQASAEEIDDELDALLHEATLTVTGWNNYWTARESDVSYEQDLGNVIYYHRGARYRVRIAE